MNSVWHNLYDKSKDRRYGVLFLSAIPAFIGLLVVVVALAAVLQVFAREEYFPQVLAGTGLLGFTLGLWIFRREQMRRRTKSQHPPLSRDELRVARSKLRNGSSPGIRSTVRGPDMDLKY